jgi:hypothetical protein
MEEHVTLENVVQNKKSKSKPFDLDQTVQIGDDMITYVARSQIQQKLISYVPSKKIVMGLELFTKIVQKLNLMSQNLS